MKRFYSSFGKMFCRLGICILRSLSLIILVLTIKPRQREARQELGPERGSLGKSNWRSSNVSDERTKANGTEVDRAASFVQCRVVFKRGPKAGRIERETTQKRTIFNFLTKKTCRIFLLRSRALRMKRKN